VALAEVFGTAMSGRCADRPELAGTPIALEAMLPAVACRGGDVLLHRLFAPLGYEIESRRLPLDEQLPDWGESRCSMTSTTAPASYPASRASR
jgi:hypothetical protein